MYMSFMGPLSLLRSACCASLLRRVVLDTCARRARWALRHADGRIADAARQLPQRHDSHRPSWRRPQVIPRPLRTTAFALDTCIAGVLGFASTPLVGLLAQHAGYHQSFSAHQPPAEAVRNARALENSLLLLILVSSVAKFVARTLLLLPTIWGQGFCCPLLLDLRRTCYDTCADVMASRGACVQVYTALYWTIRRDRIDEEKDEGAAAPVAASIGTLAPSRETALARTGASATGGSPAPAAEPVERRVGRSGPTAV